MRAWLWEWSDKDLTTEIQRYHQRVRRVLMAGDGSVWLEFSDDRPRERHHCHRLFIEEGDHSSGVTR